MPIARAMVNVGVTGAEMQSAIAQAFVQASLDSARLKNGKVNQSKVAIMTGYSRTEIRKVLTGFRGQIENEKPFGAKRILDGWSRDPEFSTRTGLRKPLVLHGRYGSFHSLAKRYSGDIPPKATLDELVRTGLVVVRKGRVVAGDESNSEQNRRQDAVTSVCDRLRAAFESVDAQTPRRPAGNTDSLEFEFDLESTLSIAEERARQSGRAFMNGVSASLKTIALPEARSKRPAKKKLRVVLEITRQSKSE
jgi:hypothetical protein